MHNHISLFYICSCFLTDGRVVFLIRKKGRVYRVYIFAWNFLDVQFFIITHGISGNEQIFT